MNRLRGWLLPAIWAGMLFVFSSGPGPDVPLPVRHLDKLQHAGAYAVLGALTARALARTWPGISPARCLLAAAVGAAAYGATDEIHQSFVPGRHSDPFDVAADGIGGLAGAAGYAAWHRRRLRKDPIGA